jgi:hypothetical protein
MIDSRAFDARVLATCKKIESLASQPDVNSHSDPAWKAVDAIISKIYTHLTDEGEDDPPGFLYTSLLRILADDHVAHGKYTIGGLVALTTRAQQTQRLVDEFRRLDDEDGVKFVVDPYRAEFLGKFESDMHRGALMKAVSDELLARGVKRMARDNG